MAEAENKLRGGNTKGIFDSCFLNLFYVFKNKENMENMENTFSFNFLFIRKTKNTKFKEHEYILREHPNNVLCVSKTILKNNFQKQELNML